jgi:ubiquinone/menaquinone biosynthesis C-methylase UbiE
MAAAASTTRHLNTVDLVHQVSAMYTDVALRPDGEYHFEMGRTLAERLGYSIEDLRAAPEPAIESFAGVGYCFDLAALGPGEHVVDLGSGSGMDAFVAAAKVGPVGHVTGIDMTGAQLTKAEQLREAAGIRNVAYRKAYIDETGLPDASADVVISNGVINLAADKPGVFKEAARVLRSGGRLAIADIVTDRRLPEQISCDATLWAACIGGAMQIDDYVEAIERAGFSVSVMKANPEYRFLSKSAQGATRTFGVRSVSLLAGRR